MGMLFDRDYRVLTDVEQKIMKEAESALNARSSDGAFSSLDMFEYWEKLTHPMWCYKSLFPNNYLSHGELKSTEFKQAIIDFETLLNDDISERQIIDYIKSKRAYFIIGSLLTRFDFGHHDAYLFPEFPLPPTYKADYLVVGKNSGGYEFIFVELENPKGDIIANGGEWGTTVRKGIKQIEDWDSWIDANFSHLKLVFDTMCKTGELLPNEFYQLDKTRIHYVIIAGRRKDYSQKTYNRRRRKRKDGLLIMHYDNLVDCAKQATTTGY